MMHKNNCQQLNVKTFATVCRDSRLSAAHVHLSDRTLCASVLTFLKEGKTCQGERPASTADDTLDKYLIALQQKNR